MDRLSKHVPKWYLRRRWPLAGMLTLLVVIPIAALGAIAVAAASDSVRQRVADGQLAIGRSLAQQAARDIIQIEEQAARIATSSAMSEAVASGDAGTVQTILDRVSGERSPRFVRIAAYDAENRLLGAAPRRRSAVTDEGGAARVREATVRVSGDRAQVVLALPVPAPGAAGSVVGMFVVELDLGHVARSVEEARFGTDGRATLALADGTVLVTGDDAKRGRVLPGVVGRAKTDGPEQQAIEDYYSPTTNERELAAVTRLDNGWFLVVTQPHEEAFAPVQELRRDILVSAIGTLVVGGLAALWIAGMLQRAHHGLVASEHRLRQITNVAEQGFVAMDGEGRVNEWNPAATRMFGWTDEDARNRLISELIEPPELRGQDQTWIEQFVNTESAGSLTETIVIDRAGRRFPIELIITALPGLDIEYFAFMRDISDRRQLEDERVEIQRRLLEANERLRLADELKSDFLAMASHELRTPLTAISGFAKTMASMWTVLPDDAKLKYVGIIDDQADRLVRLVTDLLTLSRIERGRLHVVPVSVDVPAAVTRAVRDSAFATDIRVDGEPGVRATVDEDHLQQILINLVSNAVKYGRPPIRITVEPYGNRWVDVAVADEGAGVPMEFVPLLFERFTQAPETSSDLRSGAGLGLSIVSGLVTAQGGSLWYEPNEPRGARFTVRLPRSTN